MWLTRSYTCVFTLIVGSLCIFFFFFNDTATTEIYTLSLHDALPICDASLRHADQSVAVFFAQRGLHVAGFLAPRSEEHTSELQSPCNLVCRLLLEKKKKELQPMLIVFRIHKIHVHDMSQEYLHYGYL